MAATSLFNETKETMPTDALIEQPTNVMSIIHTAVAGGADPDQLSKLLDLQERLEKNEARKAYNRAMKSCQEEMPVVVTDSENSHTRSRYASLEAVTTTIKPIYTRNGFSLSYGEGDSREGFILVTCKCMHEAGHTEEFALNCPYDTMGAQGKATKTAIQGMGSSVHYARRYLLLMIFNVTVADQDDDGNAGGIHKIGETDAAELGTWLCQLSEGDQNKFFDFMGVDSLPNIAAKDFSKALDALKRKVNSRK